MKRDLPEGRTAAAELKDRPAPRTRSLTRRFLAPLVVRRERWTLTWTGRLVLLAVLAVLMIAGGQNLCSFLAITRPVNGQFLVVEGWMPNYAYREAASAFRGGGYQLVIAAGPQQEDESTSGQWHERSATERLIGFGVPADLVMTASYGAIRRDRTFHAAMGVKYWLQAQGLRTASIDVVTVGAHARRSRLLYQRALGDQIKVGVIAVPDPQFDAEHWWQSSEGVRTVIDESIAYLYARFFFSPPA